MRGYQTGRKELVAPAGTGRSDRGGLRMRGDDFLGRSYDPDRHEAVGLGAAGLHGRDDLVDLAQMQLDEVLLEYLVGQTRVVAAGEVEGLHGFLEGHVLGDERDVDEHRVVLAEDGVLGEDQLGGDVHLDGLGGGIGGVGLGGVVGDDGLRDGGDAEADGEHEQDAMDVFHGLLWVVPRRSDVSD